MFRSTNFAVLPLLALFGVAACATPLRTSSIPPAGGGFPTSQGMVAYSLPRAYLRAELFMRATQGPFLRVFEAYNAPDSRYSFLVSARPSALSNDTLEIHVDPATGLLQSVSTTVEDRTVQVLEALAQSAGGVSGMGRGGRTGGDGVLLLARVDFDPLDPASVTAAETALKAALPQPLQSELRLSIDAPAGNFPTREQVAEACEDAICAPAYSTLTIHAGVSGRTADVVTVVPDSRRLVRIDFNRSPFVSRQTTATFTDGALATTRMAKPSEAVGAASIPLTVIRAGLSAVTEVIQLRINLNNAERGLGQSSVDRTQLPNGGESEQDSSRGGSGPGADAATLLELEFPEAGSP